MPTPIVETEAPRAAYLALEQVSERAMVFMPSVLQAIPNDEALARIRRGFESGEGREEIDKAYTQFLSRR